LQAHFQRDFLRRKNALILGMGRVFEEADMLLKYFSGMRRLHIVEWDPDKAAAIRRHFARQTYDGRIRVHLADARDMRRINDERIHLAYFSALLDLHHESVSEVRLLLEISRVLSGKGFAFSLDFMLYNRQNDLSLLRNVGLDRLNNKVVCRKSTEASKKT
jgi:hypothetical protein